MILILPLNALAAPLLSGLTAPAVRVSVIPIFSSPRRLLWRAFEIFSTALSVSESVHHLWRYRCNAERLAAAENEVDEEDGGRDTF
jgi:hypothetical protein